MSVDIFYYKIKRTTRYEISELLATTLTSIAITSFISQDSAHPYRMVQCFETYVTSAEQLHNAWALEMT